MDKQVDAAYSVVLCQWKIQLFIYSMTYSDCGLCSYNRN